MGTGQAAVVTEWLVRARLCELGGRHDQAAEWRTLAAILDTHPAGTANDRAQAAVGLAWSAAEWERREVPELAEACRMLSALLKQG